MSVELDGANNTVKTDTISEVTSANGVTIDGLSIKDGKLVTADSVIEANMSANSVDSDSYVDGSIDTAHIADGQVTIGKLASGVGFRPNANPLIINGDMAVAQRSTQVTGLTNGSSGYHTVDRWNWLEVGAPSSVTTSNQNTSSIVPTSGFTRSLWFDNTTADASLAAADGILVEQKIEGQALQLIKKGTASAETLTLGFWVASTKTGTHIVELYDTDNTRHCSLAYTINTADTWEYKLLNFPADTTGVFGNDANESLTVKFWLGAGSNFTSGTLQTTWAGVTTANRAVGQVNTTDSTDNNWQLTAVQLEIGTYTTATMPPFQHESFGDNLSRCQRYLEIRGKGIASNLLASGQVVITTRGMMILNCTPKRAVPSVSIPASILLTAANGDGGAVTSTAVTSFSNTGGRFDCNLGSATLVVGDATGLQPSGTNTGLIFDAEL